MNEAQSGEPAGPTPPRTVPGQDGVSVDQETSAKRRKVRKGTRSCWECKRRKIRCIFASSDDATCLGCQHRRTICVSQDMPEELAPAKKGNRHLSDRIARVEDLMKDVIASKDDDAINHAGRRARLDGWSKSDAPTARSENTEPSTIRAPPTPSESHGQPTPSSSFLTPDSREASDPSETETALHHLLAALPAELDTKILLRESSRTSLYNDLVNTQPHSKLTPETLAEPYPAAELPPRNAHPVTWAQCMLTLAITLQIPCRDGFLGLSEPRNRVMRRLVTAARNWVTTKEEMQGTVDGLICIILEGVFETNCGNLRRAWGIYRRAMTAAQLMGLHRSPMPPLKRIDPDLDVAPEIMWFRIVYMDRYLSLLLGLPQGTSDKSMGAMSIWRDEPPLGMFERRLTAVASRILERNERQFLPGDLTLTRSIDEELLRVSKSMPSDFWRPANFQGLTVGGPDAFLETLRLGAQVYYFGLLVQLHLPYMMRVSDSVRNEYSKITCVNAGREILTRFIAHRSFNPISSCSRPVDFFALLASMTLLLAHLEAQCYRETVNFLAHQRLSDRAMLDQVLERMDVISNVNGDAIAENSARVIRRLLEVEADAADGSYYTARSVAKDDNEQESKEEGEELRLDIPYVGVIKIARQGPIIREARQEMTVSRTYQTSNDNISSGLNTPLTYEQPLRHANDTTQDSTLPSNMPGSERRNAQLQMPGYEQSLVQCSSVDHGNMDSQTFEELPSIGTGVDDWAFQGVDTAFFESLMRGTSCADGVEMEEQWIEDPLGMDHNHQE